MDGYSCWGKFLMIAIFLCFSSKTNPQNGAKIIIPKQIQSNPTNISDVGLGILIKFEDFMSKKYPCPAGGNGEYIGYGHKIQKGENLEEINQEFAINLLKQDLKRFEKSVSEKISVCITQSQFDALVILAYNIRNGLPEEIYKPINLQKIDSQFVDDWLSYCYANNKKLKGLEKRRLFELKLFFEINIIQNQ